MLALFEVCSTGSGLDAAKLDAAKVDVAKLDVTRLEIDRRLPIRNSFLQTIAERLALAKLLARPTPASRAASRTARQHPVGWHGGGQTTWAH